MATFTEVKTAMLLHQAFFMSFMLDVLTVRVGKFPEVFGPHTATAATNGRTIWVDEDYLTKLKLPEAVFLMCHEIAHGIWAHMSRGKEYQDCGFRGKPFNPEQWNYAGDYVINAMLIHARVGKMPQGGLFDSRFSGDDLVDDVYAALMQDEGQSQGQDEGDGEGGKGNSDGDSQSDGGDGDKAKDGQPGGKGKGKTPSGKPGTTLDVHILNDDKLSDVELKRAIKSAADTAKAQGQMPGALDRWVKEMLAPKVPWVEKLRSRMGKLAGRDATTWTRPHRRRLDMQGIVMPSYTGFTAGRVVFVVDTSGSMQDKEIAQALTECDNILTDTRPESVHLLGCDADVNSVRELYDGDTLASDPPKLGGGGGTSFKPPFKWVEEQGIVPAVLVYFTDTYGDYPDEDPGYPVIWCASRPNRVAPFGETIYVEIEHG